MYNIHENQDHFARRYVYMKKVAAKAFLALEAVCESHGLNLENLLENYENENLIEKMQELQALATEDAREVLGE